ncbi:class III signal peptide-containing protein [archaeon]|nr:class III signal peptide-containing protein [archaeon]
MKKAQGSFEYIIILAVVILIALVIVSSLSAFGVFGFRNRLQENANEINNLIRDVSVSYAIRDTGYTQVALASVLDSKVTIYNITIGGCLFELNGTELYTSWHNYERNCSALTGEAGESYDYTCTISYIDAKGILHRDVGRCFGFYEE